MDNQNYGVKWFQMELCRDTPVLAKNGYESTIVITSRNMDLGNSALEKLRGEFPTAKFDLVQWAFHTLGVQGYTGVPLYRGTPV